MPPTWLTALSVSVGLLLGWTGVAHSEDGTTQPDGKFAAWLEDLRTEAIGEGISQPLLDQVLAEVRPNPRVVELDRRQPEFTITFTDYLNSRASDTRIARGRERMAEFSDTIRAVGQAYGVQPRFIAAIWGLETNYGGATGGYSVVQSLATLAYDARRSNYFRGELIAALHILDEGHIAPERMIGSWAGAMGQSQFMPSSFREYAEDFDGDGRRDIWTTEADVFASIAHYLQRYGWRDDVTWGRRVELPPRTAEFEDQIAATEPIAGCRRALNQHSRALKLSEWQALGVRRMNGAALPDRDLEATLVRPGGEDGPAYLTYSNFRSILRYNCSNFYAIAIGTIADGLRGAVE